MNITVTRRYKGVTDVKGNVSSVYNYGGVSQPIVNNYYATGTTTADPTKTTVQPTFHICINFKELITYTYKSMNDMVLTILAQEYEDTEATLSIAYGAFIGQFETFTITPTSLGMIILKGEFKL